MLFDKDRHEPLTKTSWDKNIVQAEISSIIDDIQRSLLPDACWPTHPLDAESYPRVGPKWSAYAGAAGTIHALQILSEYGYRVNNLSGLIEGVYQSFLKTPDVSVEPGLQIGELGILMPAILVQPDNEKLSRLVLRCMEDTIDLPLYEITSGQSGMMHAALALYRKSGKSHWKDLFVKGAKSLMDNWTQDTETGEWLWQSQVFGPKRHYYGACHGVTGNANILLQGADLLPEGYTEMIIKRTVATLNISVKQKDNLANWKLCTKPDIDKLLVQWCHGAAGVVTAMSRTPAIDSPESKLLDELLDETGELVWQAGPLLKGSNICHGTSGNGYAFLYLYQKTGKSVWLERARKFAMHSIEQCQKARLHYGQGRFTLWTGDAGLAIYLYHCIYPEKAAIPGLDLF
jgi:lantibiotic modifying enzyme